MSQVSQITIDNVAFGTFRSNLNDTLSALNTTQSGTSRPSGAVSGTIWLDTTSATTPTLKYYDGADDISLATLDHSANTVNWLDSAVSVTGLTTTATGTVLTLQDTNIEVSGGSTQGGEIRFKEDSDTGSNYTALKAGNPASNVTFTLPTADGTSGQAITTDGSGALSFSSVSVDETLITGQTAITSLADTDKFLVSDASDSDNLKYVEKQYLPSGDFVKLGTVSTNNSNVSALTIDNCFSSTYDLYRIVGFHNATTNGAQNYFRWRTGGAIGSSYTTANYDWINHGKFNSGAGSGDYFNGNNSSDHGRVASDMDSDSNSSFVSFNLLVADPLTTLMSRGQVTGTSVVRQSTNDRWLTTHLGITNTADVSATGFEMTVSTGNISYGRVSVYGMKQA